VPGRAIAPCCGSHCERVATAAASPGLGVHRDRRRSACRGPTWIYAGDEAIAERNGNT